MKKLIGIMGAMPEEIDGIVDLLTDKEEHVSGGRIYYRGLLNAAPVVVVFSRWGKVAAAITVSALILKFGITELIFTGVAGAIDPELRIGDIVIGNRLVQHDMDARPLMEQFEIPMLGKKFIDSSKMHVEATYAIICDFLQDKENLSQIDPTALLEFGIQVPQVIIGGIASGDKFISTSAEKAQLQQMLPDIQCVEMEGASVAQVCYEYAIPFVLIRIISDTCDENSEVNFPAFIKNISSKYAAAIINKLIEKRVGVEVS